MKFLLSCTSSRQDQKALTKYYRLELQPAYLDDFVQSLLRFAPHLTFLHSKLVLYSLESLFTRVRLHSFSYLVFYLQLIGSEGAYYRLGSCILSPLCPIFITVSTTSDFSALQISLTIIFHKSTFTSIFFIWSSTSRWQDLKRLIKYNQLEAQFANLVTFAQFLLRFAPHLTLLHSKLVLHSLESLFTRVRLHLCSYLVLYLQLVGSEGAQKILPARGTACIFSRLCPIFNTVPPDLTFLHSKLVLHSLE